MDTHSRRWLHDRWFYGRMPAVRHAWPMVLIISVIHRGLQLGLVPFTPILSTFLAATVAIVVLYPLSRWERYDRPAEEIDERPAMQDSGAEQDEGEGERDLSIPPGSTRRNVTT